MDVALYIGVSFPVCSSFRSRFLFVVAWQAFVPFVTARLSINSVVAHLLAGSRDTMPVAPSRYIYHTTARF